MIAPVPVQDIHAGREAFQRDLAKVLGDRTLTDRGWVQPNDITLLVPVFARAADGMADLYLLRLVFDHYPDGPPSAQFVNPQTHDYLYPRDVAWVPFSEGAPNIHFHPNYDNTQKQLICSSSTLEFYKVNHSVEPQHVWDYARMNFMTTLAAVKAAMAAPYYKGRGRVA